VGGGGWLTGRGVLEEKGCGMGSQEFHDLANVTQALIRKGSRPSRARIDIAQTRLLGEETRDLRLRAQDARAR